jgi:hypothetical protein
MNSPIPNAEQDATPDPSAADSSAYAHESHREFADRLVKSAVEGLNRLAREKAAAKAQEQTK